MYKDIISYELADDVSTDHLFKIAKQIVNDWMRKQHGFVKWEIHENKSGGFTDIVYWKSEQDAKNSEKDMVNIPNAADWFACYKSSSVSSKKLLFLAEY